MTTEVLNKEIVNYIISDIELTLQRLGINVQLSIEQCEDYKHEKFDKLISTSFQTGLCFLRKYISKATLT